MPYKGVRRAGTGDTSRTVLSSVCQPQADRRGFSSEIGRPVVMPPPLPVVMPPPPPVQSEKLVDGAGESASAPTLQEQDVSSLEVILDTTSSEVLITAHSGTASQHTSTLIFSTTCCEELVEAAAEFASGQALQDPDVASSKEESITAGPQTAPHDTVNGSSSAFPSTCDKFVSIPTVTQQDDLDKLFSKLTNEFHGSSSEASITASPRTLPHNITSSSLQSASSIGSNILIRHPPDCFQTFYIRMDRRGSFCTYPDVGGPFHSVHEADDAIKRFLDELRHGGRCKEQDAFSHGDRMKQDCKYFLDGPPIDPNLRRSKTTYDEERYLIEALLDRYNGSYKMLVRSCTSDTQDMWRRTSEGSYLN
ncbi:uncharacterized protein LOC101773089 isoform X3 [Setaria italica]|nr:uncharacterized protein LOC101773089 isoform X3 [Setaria italica]